MRVKRDLRLFAFSLGVCRQASSKHRATRRFWIQHTTSIVYFRCTKCSRMRLDAQTIINVVYSSFMTFSEKFTKKCAGDFDRQNVYQMRIRASSEKCKVCISLFWYWFNAHVWKMCSGLSPWDENQIVWYLGVRSILVFKAYYWKPTFLRNANTALHAMFAMVWTRVCISRARNALLL